MDDQVGLKLRRSGRVAVSLLLAALFGLASVRHALSETARSDAWGVVVGALPFIRWPMVIGLGSLSVCLAVGFARRICLKVAAIGLLFAAGCLFAMPTTTTTCGCFGVQELDATPVWAAVRNVVLATVAYMFAGR